MTDPSQQDLVPRRGTGWLTAGTVVNGVAAYVFITVGQRVLGAEAYAPVAVVWTSWTLVAAAVLVPVQHLVIVRRASGQRFVAREVAVGVVVAAAVLAGVAAALGERLFTVSSPVPPIAVGIILVGSFALGIDRGRLAAAGDFRGLGLSLAVEGVVRLVVLVPVVLLGGGTEWVVVALLSALAALLVPSQQPRGLPTRGVRADLVDGVLFGAGNALAVVVLAAGPVMLPLLGAPASQVTAFFLTVTLLRAPYLLLTGVSPRVSDALLRTRAAGAAVVRPAVVAATLVLGTILLGGLAVVVGPPLVAAVFGADAALDGVTTGLLAAAHVLALATLVLALVPVTVDRPHAVTRAWGPAAAVWLVLAVGLPVDAVRAVAWAMVAAEALVASVLLVELVGWSRGMPRRRLARAGRPTHDDGRPA